MEQKELEPFSVYNILLDIIYCIIYNFTFSIKHIYTINGVSYDVFCNAEDILLISTTVLGYKG